LGDLGVKLRVILKVILRKQVKNLYCIVLDRISVRNMKTQDSITATNLLIR